MTDFRRSLRGRRQRWFGAKRHVKRLLGLPVVHPVMRTVARRVPSVPIGRLPAPASLGEVTGYAGGASYVLMAPDRCEIAKELYWGNGRRPRAEDALALDVVVALARDADVFLDIGAYTGVFTMATTAANPRLQAHAYEIVPAVAAALRRNIERNGVADRAVAHEQGVGDPAATMRVPTGEGGSALPSFYAPGMAFADGAEVTFTSLDEVAAELGPGARVVMKIDVEGGEPEVLEHGAAMLGRHRPDMLCEVLPTADGERLTRLLEPYGYRYYLVVESELRPHDRVAPDPRFRDWLVTTRSAAELRDVGVTVAD